jgi:hypothetical protein
MPGRRQPRGLQSRPRAGSAGQDAQRHQKRQTGYQQEQTVPAHRQRDPICRDKLPQDLPANCRKLIQFVRMPTTIEIARPIPIRGRLLFFMMIDISSLA